jgi:sulfite exporter TauE/SafE
VHSPPVLPTADLLAFLTLGLLGGFGHCVGMCSPFVLFVSRRCGAGVSAGEERSAGLHAGESRPLRRGHLAAFVAQAWYTVGRIVTYAALGGLAGAFGGVVQRAGAFIGLQRAAMILAGCVLVVWALVTLSDLVPRFETGGRLFARVLGALKGRVPGHPLAIGLFLGLLPCGFLYSAVIAAVARGGALEGAAALALFGAGTAPALLGVSVADEFLGRNRAVVNRLSQAFLLAMGIWFLWRGLAGLWGQV